MPLLIFFFSSVPSVYPRNVTVQVNGSSLVIRWKPPPDDKINGVLNGYNVIIRHGDRKSMVSNLFVYSHICIIFLTNDDLYWKNVKRMTHLYLGYTDSTPDFLQNQRSTVITYPYCMLIYEKHLFRCPLY